KTEAGKKMHTARSRNDEVATCLRMFIQRTIKEGERYGFKIIYADTDGLYATMEGVKSKEELLEKTYKFLREMNKKLPKDMELEFEGYYKRGLFVTKKKLLLLLFLNNQCS
ncbi:MAG TPA: hypothetical protein EYP82_05645, partial [Hydrogenothermaceae bacterium]|nr:hypothetical protein [Hydrogenothermaceae bacterium]